MSVDSTPARRLTMSRRGSAQALTIGVVFVVLGGVLIAAGNIVGWFVCPFFGLGVLVLLVGLANPPTLTLDADGFRLTNPVRHRVTHRLWSDCGPFEPFTVARTAMAVYRIESPTASPRRVARRLTGGADEGIQAGFDGLDVDELTELLNRYRDAAVGGVTSHNG